MSFPNLISNHKLNVIKHWCNQLLKHRYQPHEEIIERINSALNTDQDVQDFGKLMMEVYEAGFMKAFNDYKKEAEKRGIRLSIKPDPGEDRASE